jgi:hypothetical protein
VSPTSSGSTKHFTVTLGSLSPHRNSTIAQQRTTSPDDAFKLLGHCETLRESKTHRRGSQRSRAKAALDAQKKKLSDRQNVDKSSARLSAVDYVIEFQKLTSTSTAMVAGHDQ